MRCIIVQRQYCNKVYASNINKPDNIKKYYYENKKEIFHGRCVYVDTKKMIVAVKETCEFIKLYSHNLLVNKNGNLKDYYKIKDNINLFLKSKSRGKDKSYSLFPYTQLNIKKDMYDEIEINKVYKGKIISYNMNYKKNNQYDNYIYAFIELENGFVVLANLMYKNNITYNGEEVMVKIIRKNPDGYKIAANVVAI